MTEKKLFVRDYMSQRGLAIDQHSSFRKAVEAMIREKTNGMVVIDEKNKVKGIISSWDIIKYLVPDYLEDENHLASFEAESEFAKRVMEIADDSIEKFMTKKIHCAHATDNLMEAAALLAEHGIRQLPVVDEENTLIGYINRTDIKLAIGEVMGIKQ